MVKKDEKFRITLFKFMVIKTKYLNKKHLIHFFLKKQLRITFLNVLVEKNI